MTTACRSSPGSRGVCTGTAQQPMGRVLDEDRVGPALRGLGACVPALEAATLTPLGRGLWRKRIRHSLWRR